MKLMNGKKMICMMITLENETFKSSNLVKIIDFYKCCKKEFPVAYMRTSHIKKRKYASDEEKLDFNIVFALCPTCDIAFENGDIYVEDGYFKVTSKPLIEDLAYYLGLVENSLCNCYKEGNKRYFKWHMDYHMMKIPSK